MAKALGVTASHAGGSSLLGSGSYDYLTNMGSFGQTSGSHSTTPSQAGTSWSAQGATGGGAGAGPGAAFGIGGGGGGSSGSVEYSQFAATPLDPGVGGTSGFYGGGTTAYLLNMIGGPTGHNAAPFSGNAEIDAALIGSRWGVSGLSSYNLTYSFPTAANQYQTNYGTQGAGGFSTNPGGFLAFNAQQQTAAIYAMNNIASFSNLSFSAMTETTSAHATIRFSQTTDVNLGSAHAGFPTNLWQAGDVWMGTQGPQPYYTTPTPGNWGQATIMHELGHAIGLKHGHQNYTNQDLSQDLWSGSTRYGSGALPANHDGQSWSLMTYRSDPNNNTSFQGDGFNQPQTYMQDDIAAIQYLYGANYGAGSNNTATTYTFSPTTGRMFINGVGQTSPSGNIIYRTIWDGGGVDTYDLSNYTTNMSIDLRPGNWSLFDTSSGHNQLANNRAYSGGVNYAPGHIANALLYNGNTASLIENAIGGSGNDIFWGNAASNSINGGGGTNTMGFTNNNANYTFSEDATHYYVIAGNGGTDTLTNIQRLQFNDGTVIDDYHGGINGNLFLDASVGSYHTGNIQFHGDRDWFSTSLTSSVYYTIREAGSPTGAGTLSDTYLRLYDSTGMQIAYNDDNGIGFNSQIVWRAGTSGNYYLGAGAFADTYTGTYVVSIEQTAFHNDGSWTGAGAGEQGWYVGDFNGDGYSDIMRYGSSTGSEVLRSNGTSFIAPVNWTNAGNLGHWWIGDFNGDGRDDIFRYNPGVSGAEVQLSTGSAFALPASWTGGGQGDQGWYVGDFNGDGRDDILRYNSGVSGGEVLLSNGTGFDAPTSWIGAGNNGHWYVGDFNGDGKDDVARFIPGSSGFQVFLSDGSSFSGGNTWLNADTAGDDGWYVADFNGDRRADIMRYVPGLSGGQTFISNGSSFYVGGSWTGAGHGDTHWYLGSFDGDTGADLLRIVSGVGNEVFSI